MCLPVFVYGHGITSMFGNRACYRAKRRGATLLGLSHAILFGSIFPDSGYAVNHEYGELMHWSPFLNAGLNALAEIQDEQEKLVTACFLAGLRLMVNRMRCLIVFFCPSFAARCAWVTRWFLDAYGYESAATSKPEIVLPGSFLVGVLQRDFGMDVTVDKLELGARTIKSVVIDNFHILAPNFVEMYDGDFSWTRENFLEPATVGGLVSEIEVTKAYLDSLFFQRVPESPSDFLPL